MLCRLKQLLGPLRLVCVVAAFITTAVTHTALAQDAPPLHERIDKLIDASQVGPQVPLASDAVFLRRVYLDLVGTIPSATATRAFLDDKTADKRAKLIDRLLASPAFARHMATTFDVMLMERRGDKHVKSPEWQKYLLTSFQTNKPYDQLAREILGADGSDPKLRPAAKFYLDRDVEANLLTREVGRMFFGVDLQCAQCHDHPLIDDYVQTDYYGIYAFLNRSYVFQPDKKKPAVLAEKGEGQVSFKSVFTEESGNTRPRLPGSAQIDEPAFAKGEEYKVKPAKNVKPVPKFSRREQLAKLATTTNHGAFNRNIANRLWAIMMGRGLVHPVDLHHSDNPPSHPELLDHLGEQIAAMKYDMRAFLREVALSRAYQRSFQMPEKLDAHVAAAREALPKQKAELKQLTAHVRESRKGIAKLASELEAANKTLAPFVEAVTKAQTAATAAKKLSDVTTKTLAAAKTQLAAKQTLAASLTEASTKTQAAAAKLPKEAPLQAAAKVFQDRAKKATDEVAAATKEVADKTALAKAPTEKTNAANQTVAAAHQKLATARKKPAAVETQWAAVRVKVRSEMTTINSRQRRIDQSKAMIAFGEQSAALAAARVALVKSQADLAAARPAAEKAAADVMSTSAQLPAIQKAASDAAVVAADSAKPLAAKQEVAVLLSEAAAKVKAAQEKLPGDAELAKALATLNNRAAAHAAELSQLKQQHSVFQAAAKAAADKLAGVQKNINTAKASVTAAATRISSLDAAVKQLTDKIADDAGALETARDELTSGWTARFSVAAMQPLQPEQIAWSVMQATGVVDRQRIASAAELNKKTPLKPEEQKDPAEVAARAQQIDQATHDKLKGNVAAFVKLFGAGAAQPQYDFFATVDQALFLANGSQLRGWLAPGGGNLTDRLNKLEDPKALGEELYLSVVNRRPTEQEVADVTEYLASRPKEKPAVVQEIVWALLTSAEFRFDH
jgi:hypothetical protein